MGMYYQIFNSNGECIFENDSRIFEEEVQKTLTDLDFMFSEKYLELLDIPEIPLYKRQRKLDQARLQILEDKALQYKILERDKYLKNLYTKFKNNILKCKTLTEIEEIKSQYVKIFN